MAAATTPTPYLGSKISLISKSEIRYEGILYTVDTKESTIALAKVKSFGTEDRPTEHPVPARDDVYEYIIFKAVDIKDLMVCEVPKQVSCLVGGLPNDPAIVQISTGQLPSSLIPGLGGAAGAHLLVSSGSLAAAGLHQAKDASSKESSEEQTGGGGKGNSRRSDQKSGGRQKRKSNSQADGAGERDRERDRDGRRERSDRSDTRQHQQPSSNNNNRRGGGESDRRQQQDQDHCQSSGRNNNNNDRGDRNRRDDSRENNINGDRRDRGYQMIPAYNNNNNYPRNNQMFVPFNRGYSRPQMGYGQMGALPFRRGEMDGQRGPRRYDDRYGMMVQPRVGGGYYPDRRAGGQDYYQYQQGQGRRFPGANRGYDFEPGRMPRQPFRGSQQRLQQLKFEGDYDFEEANNQFKETLEKLSSIKIGGSEAGNNAEEEGKENGGGTDGEKKADEGSEDGEVKDDKFYDKSKSFFDAISCEAVERTDQKPSDKNQRGVQRQKNQETFGQSAVRHYGFGSYRRFGNRAPMRNVPLRYRS